MSDTARKPLKPWQRRRRVWLAAVVCIVLAFVALALYGNRSDTEIQHELEILRAEGAPLNRPELESWLEAETPPDAPLRLSVDHGDGDALAQALLAEDWLTYLEKRREADRQLFAAAAGITANLALAEKIFTGYASQRARLMEISERLARGESVTVESEREYWLTERKAEEWANLLASEAMLAALQGAGARAGECLLAHLRLRRMGFSQNDRPRVLPSPRIGIAQMQVLVLTAYVLPHVDLPAPVYEALLAEYASEFDPDALRRIIVASRVAVLEDFESAIRRYESTGTTLPDWAETIAPGALGVGVGALDAFGWYEQGKLRYLRASRELEEITTLPPPEAVQRSYELSGQLQSLFDSVNVDPYLSPARIDAYRIRQWYQHLATLAIGSVIVSAELYRLEHGAPPDSLDNLTAEARAALPDDPFAGAPIGYQRDRDGYLVYSIGEDLRDDTAGKLYTGQWDWEPDIRFRVRRVMAQPAGE